jgi:arylamine N-acetyltransferase
MQSLQPTNGLSNDLVNRILSKLDIPVPATADLISLQSLYAAWCYHLPFDNIRKMIALRTGGNKPLPGLDAEEFFENWLANGAGATCWPMANAFYELILSFGYKASRVAGYMLDLGILNHGSVKVSVNKQEYFADAPLLLNVLLPLGQGIFIHNDPVTPVELEPKETSNLVWIKPLPGNEYFYCRMISDPVSYSLFEEGYEASRTGSIFNQRLYARRNHPGEMIVLWGNARFSKTVNGIEIRELSPDELCDALHKDIGISYPLINEWAASGSLDNSFEKPSGTRPPAVEVKPPSQR